MDKRISDEDEEDGFTSLENASAVSKAKQHTVHGKAHASSGKFNETKPL
jgi:hypothetical protein